MRRPSAFRHRPTTERLHEQSVHHLGATVTDSSEARPTPRRRGEGQWGLGYHEPLNTAEQIKKDDDGLNVRERIDRIFAPGGFRSIGKQDLRSRLRWWGLYTQRKQGVPGETHRQRRARGARGRVLHAADPHRRRADDVASSSARSRG